MGDREGDISIPLLSIADDAGGEWPSRARRALMEVFGLRNAVEGNAEAGAMMLAMEERPWPEWQRGQAMTASRLARVLAPFGVRPRFYRMEGLGKPTKGYQRDDFAEAWAKYLPPASHPVSARGGGLRAPDWERAGGRSGERDASAPRNTGDAGELPVSVRRETGRR